MALRIDIQVAVRVTGLPTQEQFRQWARRAWLDAEARAEVVLRVASEAESRRLNDEFRGRDRPTNVLSFPYEPLPELGLHHVGDIVLCAPVVAREAAEQGKPEPAHWAHMVVHGMLHLQGYDHIEPADAVEMESLEAEILNELGFADPYADEDRS
jgi:probable rRNA maturation factor